MVSEISSPVPFSHAPSRVIDTQSWRVTADHPCAFATRGFEATYKIDSITLSVGSCRETTLPTVSGVNLTIRRLGPETGQNLAVKPSRSRRDRIQPFTLEAMVRQPEHDLDVTVEWTFDAADEDDANWTMLDVWEMTVEDPDASRPDGFADWIAEQGRLPRDWILAVTVDPGGDPIPADGGRWVGVASVWTTFHPDDHDRRYQVYDALDRISRRKGKIETKLTQLTGLDVRVRSANVIGPDPKLRPRPAPEPPPEGDRKIHRKIGPLIVPGDDT